jgi:2-methylcitrate dehydratase PrpD
VDTFGAQFSIPYCCALAVMGDPGDPAMYAPEVIDDPERRELARRVEIVVDPEMEAAYPRHYGARVALELESGATRSSAKLDPHGMPADPCTRAELLAKFERLAARTCSPATVSRLVETVRTAAQLPGVAPLTALLRG